MSATTDNSLPWQSASSGESCPLDPPCGATMCMPGTQGNLPVPGPQAVYCFGSISPNGTPCSRPIDCPPIN
jgi:hypothetical protein